MIYKIPFHAFLIGIFPVLCAFSSLVNYLLPEELIIPILVSLAMTTVIFVTSYLVLRSLTRAGTVTSAAILLIYCFDFVSVVANKLLSTVGATGDDRLYLIAYLALATWTIVKLGRAKTEYKVLTAVLNTTGGILVFGHIAYISNHELSIRPVLEKIYAQQDADVAAMKLDAGAKKPDIYYIILDAMGRHDTLEEFYKLDNSAFLSRLEEQGFVIPRYSKSNYPLTSLSLPSSLNMDYLNYLQKTYGKKSTEYTPLYRLIQRNKVELALKRLGYSYTNVSSGFSPTDYMQEADANLGFRFGNIFHLALVRTTVLGPFQRDFDFLANLARATRLYPFENIGTIMRQPKPKFVLIHIVLPHPPFLFKEDGGRWELDRITFSAAFERTKYAQQVKYVQNRTLSLLKELSKDKFAKENDKIIILQGDHGPFAPQSDAVVEATYDTPTENNMRVRMSIFNAYKLPGVDKSKIYDGISPVNSFRLLFNEYFKADLKLMPDECYYAPAGFPYDLSNVTRLVKP
jgi:Sulfatase.